MGRDCDCLSPFLSIGILKDLIITRATIQNTPISPNTPMVSRSCFDGFLSHTRLSYFRGHFSWGCPTIFCLKMDENHHGCITCQELYKKVVVCCKAFKLLSCHGQRRFNRMKSQSVVNYFWAGMEMVSLNLTSQSLTHSIPFSMDFWHPLPFCTIDVYHDFCPCDYLLFRCCYLAFLASNFGLGFKFKLLYNHIIRECHLSLHK